MRHLLKLVSLLALGLTVLPAVLVFAGRIDWPAYTTLMLAGTVLWFATAPFWMRAGDRKA